MTPDSFVIDQGDQTPYVGSSTPHSLLVEQQQDIHVPMMEAMEVPYHHFISRHLQKLA